jgi:hypothetical protein
MAIFRSNIIAKKHTNIFGSDIGSKSTVFLSNMRSTAVLNHLIISHPILDCLRSLIGLLKSLVLCRR